GSRPCTMCTGCGKGRRIQLPDEKNENRFPGRGRTPQEVASGLCTTFDADIPDGERFVVNRVKVRRNQPDSSKIGLKVRCEGPQLSISVRSFSPITKE